MTIRFQYGRFKFIDKGDLRNVNIQEDRTESSRLARLAVKTYRMSYKDLKPTTLSGIKSLAKTIKRNEQTPHVKSLDIASKQAGYIDYEQARIKLEPVK